MEPLWCKEGHISDFIGTRCKECLMESPEVLPSKPKRPSGQYSDEYRLENIENNFVNSIIARNHASRFKRKQVLGRVPDETENFTPEDISRIMELQGGCCQGCYESFSKTPFEVDHILALEHGGKNSPNNLQLLCRHCNSSKREKCNYVWMSRKRKIQILEFLEEYQEELSLIT